LGSIRLVDYCKLLGEDAFIPKEGIRSDCCLLDWDKFTSQKYIGKI
jgi:hypothetical protein